MNIAKIAGVALFSLTFAGQVHAQEVTVQATSSMPARVEVRKEIQNDFRDAVKEKRESIKTEIETRKENLKAKASERLSKAASRATEHLLAAIDRLSQIRTKIESRIAKIDAGGGSTIEAQAKVAEADTLLTAAKANVDAISTITISDSTARASLDALKTATKKAELSVKEARDAFLKVVPALRVQATATTSASVNNQ